jgi:glyoxylase-like metal-dependent hydrolase (beta-lactamase superfamily II)
MERVCNGVIRIPTSFVNAYLVCDGSGWVLIDSGLPGFSALIRKAAAEVFGATSKPEAIILTHGHFDHSGGARTLAKHWGVPVFAHKLEQPYLTGKSKYPAPDPTVGGAIGFLSRFMPAAGMNLGKVEALTEDREESGPVPGLNHWRWLATPGHSPGHISFFREDDQTLIAGDAVATMNMESPIGFLSKKRVLSRAGAPFNHDWNATASSVKKLAALRPRVLVAGHGLPMMGPDLAAQCAQFAEEFRAPEHGRYAGKSAETNDQGVVWVPPKPYDPFPKQALTVAGIAVATYIVGRGIFGRRQRS